MIMLYGIANCDSCRRARAWLNERGVAHGFHDLRTDGLAREMLARWIEGRGWQALLNRRSTTWRGLPAAAKDGLDAAAAEALICAHPTLIKRPVIDLDGSLLIGFDDSVRAAICPPAPTGRTAGAPA
jgi:Spx/MgsR family transcriptional regulator